MQFDNRGNYKAIIYDVTRLKGYFKLRCNTTNFRMHIYAAIGQVYYFSEKELDAFDVAKHGRRFSLGRKKHLGGLSSQSNYAVA